MGLQLLLEIFDFEPPLCMDFSHHDNYSSYLSKEAMRTPCKRELFNSSMSLMKSFPLLKACKHFVWLCALLALMPVKTKLDPF